MHNLVAFNRTAEVIRDYVKKGTQLFIAGKIQTRSWDDRASGAKKYRTEILIDELTLLGNRQGAGDGSSGTQPRGNARQLSQSRSSTNDEYGYTSEGITDDDIPF